MSKVPQVPLDLLDTRENLEIRVWMASKVPKEKKAFQDRPDPRETEAEEAEEATLANKDLPVCPDQWEKRGPWDPRV